MQRINEGGIPCTRSAIATQPSTSAGVLRRDGYICEECACYGRGTPQSLPVPATVAHHNQTIEEHPELLPDVNHGEALYASCHNAIHPEKCGHK